MSIPRWISAVLAVVLAAGPLGPFAAVAQTPATAAQAPATAAQAPATPAQTSATAPLQPMESMQPDTLVEGTVAPPGTGAKIGAGALNVVYLPGKAIVCGAGTLVAGLVMLATFGSAHREATSFFNEGCSGDWLVTAEQVAAAPKKVQLERGY